MPGRRCVYKAWQDKRMLLQEQKENNAALIDRTRACGGHSSALTWLSLVELLASRAQLRFTRQVDSHTLSRDVQRDDEKE